MTPDDDKGGRSLPTPGGLPRLFTPAEVAEALQVKESYVTTKARRREWPHSRMARGAIRFSGADVEAIVAMTHQKVVDRSEVTLGGVPGQTPRSAAYWRRKMAADQQRRHR